MNHEVFVTQRPKSKFLQQYISHYYFHQAPIDSLRKEFIYYPTHKNALTIYKGSKVEFGEGYSSVEPDPHQDFAFIYSGMQRQLRTALIKPPFDKIGIVFQALGINHFIESPLADFSSDPIQKSFDRFGMYMIPSCKLIYDEKNINVKVDLLDSYFEGSYRGFHEPIVRDCSGMIIDSQEKVTVNDLCEQLGVHRKTLLRLFNKHLCCSIKDYIDIVQFRKSLDHFLSEEQQASLTEIALKSDYYDQSQFINHFKKLTGVNPKHFFKNVECIGNENRLFWTFK